jgi:hypothetical protein
MLAAVERLHADMHGINVRVQCRYADLARQAQGHNSRAHVGVTRRSQGRHSRAHVGVTRWAHVGVSRRAQRASFEGACRRHS